MRVREKMGKKSEINESLTGLEQATHIHEEISLRSENQHLVNKIQAKNEQLKRLQAENQQLLEELDMFRKKVNQEMNFSEEWKEKQAELSDYKRKTFELLEQQKNGIITLKTEVQAVIKERDDAKSALLKKEKLLQDLTVKHYKMMNTKTMKWTGKYWNLRKKIQLKSK